MNSEYHQKLMKTLNMIAVAQEVQFAVISELADRVGDMLARHGDVDGAESLSNRLRMASEVLRGA